MELWADAPYWGVGKNVWGELITWDPCDSREEADEFVRDELSGQGVVMPQEELINALREVHGGIE